MAKPEFNDTLSKLYQAITEVVEASPDQDHRYVLSILYEHMYDGSINNVQGVSTADEPKEPQGDIMDIIFTMTPSKEPATANLVELPHAVKTAEDAPAANVQDANAAKSVQNVVEKMATPAMLAALECINPNCDLAKAIYKKLGDVGKSGKPEQQEPELKVALPADKVPSPLPQTPSPASKRPARFPTILVNSSDDETIPEVRVRDKRNAVAPSRGRPSKRAK